MVAIAALAKMTRRLSGEKFAVLLFGLMEISTKIRAV